MVKKQIKLNEREVEYTLKISKRARKLRLAVYCGGDFVVTSPRFVLNRTIEKFIIEKAEWVLNKIDMLKDVKKPLSKKNTKLDYLKHKKEAENIAQKKVEELNRIYKFKFNKINIRNQKTRWGSCSMKGNLNFNYKIVKLRDELANYLVVHELCHLKEFNHSKKFWDLVSVSVPNYAKLRKELKSFR